MCSSPLRAPRGPAAAGRRRAESDRACDLCAYIYTQICMHVYICYVVHVHACICVCASPLRAPRGPDAARRRRAESDRACDLNAYIYTQICMHEYICYVVHVHACICVCASPLRAPRGPDAAGRRRAESDRACDLYAYIYVCLCLYGYIHLHMICDTYSPLRARLGPDAAVLRRAESGRACAARRPRSQRPAPRPARRSRRACRAASPARPWPRLDDVALYSVQRETGHTHKHTTRTTPQTNTRRTTPLT